MRRSRYTYVHEEKEKRNVFKFFPFSNLKAIIYMAFVGSLAGMQFVRPNKRVIEAIIGSVLVFMLWNVSTISALWFLILMFPFPFAISVGNSNFVFAVLIFIIYMIRVSAGQDTFRMDRKLTLPILLISVSYIFSFYNLEQDPISTRFAFVHVANFFGTILFFLLITNFIDTEEKLEKTVRILIGATALIMVFVLLELRFPGRILVPNWLYSRHETGLITRGLRMAGPFHDFELTAEFFALMVPITLFMIIRAKRTLTRSLYTLLLVADLFMMFATITRGAFFSLGIGLAYMAFTCRRDLTFVRAVLIAMGFAVMLVVLEAFVARYTVTGSLFERIVATTFERGLIPANRVDAWGGAIRRAMEHPWIGHGPYWDLTKGINVVLWPHNVYLYYLNITGLFGLGAFVFLLYRLLRDTLLGWHASLVQSSFSEAFMKILHVCLVMFLVDQIKIEYIRNNIYVFFIWLFFGLIAATRNIILNKKREQLETAPSKS